MNKNIENISNSKIVGNNISGNNNMIESENSNIQIISKKTKWKTCIALSFILSITSVIISIIAISVTLPRNIHLQFDYIGVIIGVLSLLITILIGWQIYKTISASDELKRNFEDRFDLLKGAMTNELYSIKIETQKDIESRILEYNEYLGSVLLHSKANSMKNKRNAIYVYFKALYSANKSIRKDNMLNIIEDLQMTLAQYNFEKNDFTIDDIDSFIEILKKCEDYSTETIEKILNRWKHDLL